MSAPEADARVERLTREIASLAREFATGTVPLLRAALERAVDRLVVERAEWFNGLADDAVASLRAATHDGIARSAAQVAERLRDADVWLNPTIALARGPSGHLDDLNHRVWVAILNGADVLDPVLVEFGLEPSDVPDFGGGHFGLQPQRLADLDTRGSLERLWRRYLDLHRQRQHVIGNLPKERREQERSEARRRWFGRR